MYHCLVEWTDLKDKVDKKGEEKLDKDNASHNQPIWEVASEYNIALEIHREPAVYTYHHQEIESDHVFPITTCNALHAFCIAMYTCYTTNPNCLWFLVILEVRSYRDNQPRKSLGMLWLIENIL